MPQLTFPFTKVETTHSHEDGIENCPIYKKLQPELQEQCREHSHLFDYMHIFPISEFGPPKYYAEPTRSLGDSKDPNLIYPVRGGVFIHILVDHGGSRNHYIPIEPCILTNVDHLLPEVERLCIEVGVTDELNHEDREGQLREYINSVVTEKSAVVKGPFLRWWQRLRKTKTFESIKVTGPEHLAIEYLFLRDKVGLGALEVFTRDPYIEDISCSGIGNIFLEHKIFKAVSSATGFDDLDDLDSFVKRLAERIRKSVSFRVPIADATLPDGSRINIVYGRDVSRRGSNFTIRKFAGTPISIFQLVEFGTLNYQMLAYLSLAIGNGMNCFVSGETASGKTTMLNAITTFVPPLAKIVTIEDTPELQVPHANWIREVVQSTKAEDPNAVTMFDLLKAALRQRPNEIMIGEIRGAEGNVAFQAMQTGHSCMATFHAASVEKLIQRMTGAPISVPKTYVDNLNVCVIMDMVRLPDGRKGRRIVSISEIVGYDPSEEAFNIIDAFQWNSDVDRYDFTGYMSSYVLEHKIAPMLGIPSHQKTKVYKEMERRQRIFEKLHKDQGLTDFYEVLEVMARAQKEGLL